MHQNNERCSLDMSFSSEDKDTAHLAQSLTVCQFTMVNLYESNTKHEVSFFNDRYLNDFWNNNEHTTSTIVQYIEYNYSIIFHIPNLAAKYPIFNFHGYGDILSIER